GTGRHAPANSQGSGETDNEDTLSKPKDNCAAVEIDNGYTACADGGDDGTLAKANGEDKGTVENGDDTAGGVGKIMNAPSKSKAKGKAKKKPRIERD
ncbi:hypothetical protein PR002_g31851, partial [Phytophthora rubi]